MDEMDERQQIEEGVAALERQRDTLGDAVVDTAIAALRERLAALEATLPTAGQRKQVTILFADVVGLAAIAGTRDPEEVRDLANVLWERLDAAIRAHDGTIDKHMGDVVMALFGTPVAHEDDPERAIRAALAMQAALRALLDERLLPSPDADGPLLRQLRVGIHTGPVLLGTVGTTAEYTAMGDAVNVASRLHQAASAGSILISHDTYRHVRGVFSVQPLDPLHVKGKAEPIPVYLVKELKPRVFQVSLRGVEGIETPLVGRESEFKVLQDALSAVIEQQQARAITVVGEAGVGKSRLLNEFSAWVELSPVLVWFFKGRANPQASHLPYFLLRDLFSTRLEIQDSDVTAVAREKLVRGIASFMGPGGVEKAHFIGHLIGFDFSGSPFLRGILGDARQLRDRAWYHLDQFFHAVAAQGPALLLLEDLQWADDSSLDVIEHVVQVCQDAPLLIVCLVRPALYERRPTWGQGAACHTRLELSPLTDADSLRLVGEILRRVTNVSAELGDMIVQRAEGNPFYIEELIKVLIEDRVILKGEAQWQFRPERLAQVRLPTTLLGVLQARLDGLPPNEREWLQRAAVVGRTFWEGAVARLAPDAPDSARGALSALQRRELVFEQKQPAFAGEHEYVFKHTLLHDVAYESLLKRQRRIYHAQVAAWLIEHSRERVGEYAGLIGEHYERAGEALLAADWYGRAGRQAQATYAPATAIDYYRRALATLPADAHDAAREISLYEGLGEALLLQARLDEGLQAIESMRQAAETVGDVVATARAWNALAGVRDRQGNHPAALEHAGQAEQIARAAGAEEELVRALCRKGQALMRMGRGEAALAVVEQALALGERLNARTEVALSLNLLGSVQDLLGHFREARDYTERALALYRELGNRNREAAMLNNLGESARLQGDYDTAIRVFREALAIAEEIGDRTIQFFLRSNLGGALVGRGDFAAAEDELHQLLTTAEDSGWVGIAETHRFLAEARLGLGEVEEALAAARQSLALLQGREEPALSGPAWRVLGMVATHLGRPVEVSGQTRDAASCFAESAQLLASSGIELEQARTLQAWAQLEAAHGNTELAQQMEKEAQGLLERLGMVPAANG